MNRLIALSVFTAFALVAGGVHAADDTSPAITELLAGASELGNVNGEALACGYAELLPKTKALMILRMPKTRRFGDAYEAASSASFRARTNGSEACPEVVMLGLRLEALDLKLQDAAKRAGIQ